MVDVIIPIATKNEKDNIDLRFVLRSIQKNLIDVGKIYVVTLNKPLWLQNVIHIEADDDVKHNKDANLINKILKVIKTDPELSEEFIFWSDDQILLKRLSAHDIKLYYNGPIKPETIDSKHSWWHRVLNSYMRLKIDDEERTPMNYESHVPVIMNKHIFENIWQTFDDYDTEHEGYVINTMYFNSIVGLVPSPTTQDKVAFDEPNTIDVEGYMEIFERKLWLGYGEAAVNDSFYKALTYFFNFNSCYENDTKNIIHIAPEEIIKTEVARFVRQKIKLLLDIRSELVDYFAILEASKNRLGLNKIPEYDKIRDETQEFLDSIEKRVTIADLRTYNQCQSL